MKQDSIYKKLKGIRSQTLDRLNILSQYQLDARPPSTDEEPSWSLGEVFMHIAMDEIYLRELISRPLLEGISPPVNIHFIPPPPPFETKKEVISFWLERARTQTKEYLMNWPSNWNKDLKHEGGLEVMNALEWLEGYAGHEAYHHIQIDALIEWCTKKEIS
ncbi:DinB family protein [Chloroflexota bacterium]